MKSRSYFYHQIVNKVRSSRHLSSDSKKFPTCRVSNTITRNPQMQTLKSTSSDSFRVWGADLIYGETGTGKELFASAIHNASAGPIIHQVAPVLGGSRQLAAQNWYGPPPTLCRCLPHRNDNLFFTIPPLYHASNQLNLLHNNNQYLHLWAQIIECNLNFSCHSSLTSAI